MNDRPCYFHPSWIHRSDETLRVDLCIYGGTSAGLIAGIKATRLGLSVVVLQPGQHLGGMTTGGLGWTDYGRRHVIGGMSRQFYKDLGTDIGLEDENWHFWPSDATRRFESLIDESGLDVRRACYLDRVEMDGHLLKSLRALGGLSVEAKQFIDASYEGDLMAAAGVSHTIGRESNATYDETLNGVQVRGEHQFKHIRVDPFLVEGDVSSGLLPGVESRDLRQDVGQADHKVQAYNFRICMTDDPKLKIDWQQPEGYDARWYEAMARWLRSDQAVQICMRSYQNIDDAACKFDVLDRRTPDGYRKTDTNNNGAVSSDFIGQNYAWPTADYAIREHIFQQHVIYQRGFYWFMANDERIPEPLQAMYRKWGLSRDEFVDTGGWSHQLYVRESRRMIADHVITEHDCTAKVVAEDSVGMGSYTMDSHNCSRFVADVEGVPGLMNEGDVQVPPTDPYPISYRAVVPALGECENLCVPVCFSASHIAYGSARMEPVFMVLGESVACAAFRAITDGVKIQDVDYAKLRSMLDEAGQVLAG